jgi:hypothetical protein
VRKFHMGSGGNWQKFCKAFDDCYDNGLESGHGAGV